MKSRYDYMSEGSVIDTVLNDTYPDPLTLNYLKFKLSETLLPKTATLDMSSINKIWALALSAYGAAEYDDIVLTLNGIEHKNFLKVGDKLLFPYLEDIDRSFSK